MDTNVDSAAPGAAVELTLMKPEFEGKPKRHGAATRALLARAAIMQDAALGLDMIAMDAIEEEGGIHRATYHLASVVEEAIYRFYNALECDGRV